MFPTLIPEAVMVVDKPLDKLTAIQSIVDCACKAYDIRDCNEILSQVVDRESKLSTGIGLEIAVPHCRSVQLNRVVAAALLSTTGIEYNSVDGKPVRLIILIISPVSDITGHLASLSAVSQVVSAEDSRQKILAARTSEELSSILRDM